MPVCFAGPRGGRPDAEQHEGEAEQDRADKHQNEDGPDQGAAEGGGGGPVASAMASSAAVSSNHTSGLRSCSLDEVDVKLGQAVLSAFIACTGDHVVEIDAAGGGSGGPGTARHRYPCHAGDPTRRPGADAISPDALRPLPVAVAMVVVVTMVVVVVDPPSMRPTGPGLVTVPAGADRMPTPIAVGHAGAARRARRRSCCALRRVRRP